MKRRGCVALLVSALVAAIPATASAAKTTVFYDTFGPGYGPADYAAKWSNPYGPGELAAGGTQSFAGARETVSAAPFQTAFDFSVFDHLKYFALANANFPVPKAGSVTFASTMTAQTPGIVPGRTITGTYTQSGAPYSATLLDTQQAGVVMNVVDFCTGQLFDWFLTETKAAPLIERLPSNVTGNFPNNPNCPNGTYVGREDMYTQYIKEIPVGPGPHRMEITFSRQPSGNASVEYSLDGRKVAKIGNIGIPLDKQGESYTGTYPSLGPGELIGDQIDNLALGHGLFSVLDAFPFQHPDSPELAVSIPPSQRIFGQGAIGTWDDFVVTTTGSR